MKILPKKSYILLAISLVIIICCIGVYNYRKPITFHKTLNAIIRPNPSDDPRAVVILSKTTVEINSKMYRGLYAGIFDNKIHFSTDLKGKIIIDNKEYTFTGSSPSESNRNWFLCYVDNKDKYTGFILHDLKDIEIFK